MRPTILLGMLVSLASSLYGAERMSVHQMEQMIAAHTAPQRPGSPAPDLLEQIALEDSLAPEIAKTELTDRLTTATRRRIIARYKLGPLTQEALELVADRSALLDAPPDEVPALPPPSMAAQRSMVHRAGTFVFQTLTHLPDFFAVRTTTHYDNAPLMMQGLLISQTPGLHRVATLKREVTFREGREIMTALDDERIPLWNWGMQTQGEFGPEPAIVFLDIAQGKLAFSHWETASSGNLAVFAYSVPASASHFEVREACRVHTESEKHPAYHGTLSIDPATGALMRFTLQADAAPEDLIANVGSVIEYGPVTLGGRSFICPLQGLAFSTQQVSCEDKKHWKRLNRPILFLNVTDFTDYHRLGSESNILPGAVVQATSALPATAPAPDTPRP